MSIADDPHFDRIIQMQIDEFASQMRMATSASVAITIVETGNALQAAIHGAGSEDEAMERMKAIRAMCCVAASTLKEATKGAMTLLIRMPNGDLEDALPPGAVVKSENRHG